MSESNMSVTLYILVILFNISSWIDNDGVYAELPLLVQRLPEYWTLPSYLAIAAQIASIAPLLYFAINRVKLQNRYEVGAIYTVILTGFISCLLLVFFWDKTAYIAGQEHSMALFILTFVLALTDSSSTVVFLGYMSRLPAVYMTAYYIGDGMCGFIPSVVALIQGAGDYDCVNVSVPITTNYTTSGYQTRDGGEDFNQTEWQVQQVLRSPVFSIEVFMVFLSSMLGISAIAFSILNYHPTFKKYQCSELAHEDSLQSNGKSEINQAYSPDEDAETQLSTNIVSSDAPKKYGLGIDDSKAVSSADGRPLESTHGAVTKMSKGEMVFLLSQYSFQQGVRYGLLYSIQSYSLLPYGTMAYSLGNRLTSLMLPLASFLALFIPPRSTRVITSLTAVGTVAAIYIVVQSAMSPNPPLAGTDLGVAISVLTWLVMSASWGYSKVGIALLMKGLGRRELMLTGIVDVIGCLVLSVATFLVVNMTNVFKDAPPC